MAPPIIYNLFPRLAGTLDQWPAHAERARAMGFNWIFLNPVSQPGFSGSLYAVRDQDRVCADFLPPGASREGQAELREVLHSFERMGLRPMMDLVINHTAIDSPLVEKHPAWFARAADGSVAHPSAIDPADARKVTVWGDLAEIDNRDSPEVDELWDYWRDLVRSALDLGFRGFRCDAAYKVPAILWRVLVDEAREVDAEVLFFAETLGCRIEEVRALKPAGLDYLFNSSKYWNFDAPWALRQHTEFGQIAPSISFPESHDTPRLMAETGANLAVQRQRYLLSAVFSAGLLMPIGYEFGFTRPLDVVATRPQDWESTGVDLTGFIASVNRLKASLPALGQEGRLEALSGYDLPSLVVRRSAADQQVLILINKDWHQPQTLEVAPGALGQGAELLRIAPDGAAIRQAAPARVQLDPAEIALIL